MTSMSTKDRHIQINSFYSCQNCNGMLHSTFGCKQCNKIYCGSCVLRFQRTGKDLLVYCKQCHSLVASDYFTKRNNVSMFKKLDV